MKGIVFREFIEMVETQYGDEVLDHIIESSDLYSGGAYTAVGTYDFREMLALLMSLSQQVNLPIDALLRSFGHYLFQVFTKRYSFLLAGLDNSFDLFRSIDNHIHVEVKKLYPDAELPKFEFQLVDENIMELTYQSERKLAWLAYGLIEKALAYFRETATLDMVPLSDDLSSVKFSIIKQ